KDSITLPCAYVPVEDLVQQTLTWSVVHDKGSGTILRRDSSGDHILLSEYRDRVSIPKDVPGNVSLLILSLEISDRGTYTCHVTWRDSNNSLIAKAITTSLEVVKVAATKPIIRAEPGLTLPAGASASLTCEASGSPPISYRWFRSSPAATAQLPSSGAELAWSSLRPSDSGSYFCEAENRAGAGAVQRSDAVQLTVTGECPRLPGEHRAQRKERHPPAFLPPCPLRSGILLPSFLPCLHRSGILLPSFLPCLHRSGILLPSFLPCRHRSSILLPSFPAGTGAASSCLPSLPAQEQHPPAFLPCPHRSSILLPCPQRGKCQTPSALTHPSRWLQSVFLY
uniref:Ig-like domain-containing protein n=1 Tax=Catharus ustulatus TaxID=91951 RepID=A0A8C3UQX5_CATUS